jgi:hypothetical protein
MNRAVFLSILAMDSYNRGYAQGVNGLRSPGPNGDASGDIRIGNAKLVRDADDVTGIARSASFYAVTYAWNGETVISYQGTDFDVLNDFVRSDGTLARIEKAFNSEFFKDLTRGWGTPHP